MPRKTKTPTVVPTDAADLETQASDTVQPLLPDDHPAVVLQGEKNERFGKKYSTEQLAAINSIAMALLSAYASSGMHPDAVVNRAKEAFKNAESILPVAQEVADKDA